VLGLTDSTGALVGTQFKYDPYGHVLSGGTGSVTDPFGFQSGYVDSATGLEKFGTPYCDAGARDALRFTVRAL
jgi:hypothetical protein